jgi:hypothetical protein
MTNQEIHQVSVALDSYLRFRAKHEGVGYGFTPEFFEQAILERGENIAFFGITFTKNRLIGDEQQPELFKRWLHLN